MKPLHEIYGPKFFARRDKLLWRAEIVCNAINDVFEPESVMDVGCGIGEYVQYFHNNLGIEANGIEGSEACRPYLVSENVYIIDMREEQIVRPFANDRAGIDKFDLVVCLEVLEHIEPEYTDIFVQNLTELSDQILVSAAQPGQGGHYHVNCQPKEWWLSKFLEFNYGYDDVLTCAIKQALQPWKHRRELYHNNLIFFSKGE